MMMTIPEGGRFRVGALLAIGLAVAGGPAAGQRPTPEQGRAIREACGADYQAFCAGVPMGTAALECLAKNAAETSPACQQALLAVKGGAQQGTIDSSHHQGRRCCGGAPLREPMAAYGARRARHGESSISRR